MGVDSDNYKNILSNIEFIKENYQKVMIISSLKVLRIVLMRKII